MHIYVRGSSKRQGCRYKLGQMVMGVFSWSWNFWYYPESNVETHKLLSKDCSLMNGLLKLSQCADGCKKQITSSHRPLLILRNASVPALNLISYSLLWAIYGLAVASLCLAPFGLPIVYWTLIWYFPKGPLLPLTAKTVWRNKTRNHQCSLSSPSLWTAGNQG